MPGQGQNRQGAVQVQRQQGSDDTRVAVRDVKAELEAIRPQLIEVLPQKMDPDRFLRVVAGAVLKTPRILEAVRTQDGKISLFRAVLEAAQLGLEPTGLLGSAYLVPYRVKGTLQVQLIPGYRGLIDLARRSGEIESIYAQIVREKDYFRIRQGTDPGIDHEPFIPPAVTDPKDPEQVEAADPGRMVGAYMVAVLRDRAGAPSVRQIEWMTAQQIEAVRKRSRAADDGPWVTDQDEMSRKTVVRRGAKYLPLTPEAVRAFSLDEEAERVADHPETGASRRESGRSRLLSTIAQRKGLQEGGEGGQESGDGEAGSDEADAGSDPQGEAPASPGKSGECGAVPPEGNPLEMVQPCTLQAGHSGHHRSDEGSFPAE